MNLRDNGITPLRLFLALAVLLFHAWPLGGFGSDPLQQLLGERFDGGGTIPVLGFFGLSGFLLAASRQRSNGKSFALRRAARILPGYWVCVLLVGLLGGLGFISAAWLPGEDTGRIGIAAFASSPYGPNANSPVWSLWPEMLCYGALTIVPARLVSRTVPALALLVVLGHIWRPEWPLVRPIIIAFAAGAVLAVYRDRIPIRLSIAAGLLLMVPVAEVFGLTWIIGSVAVAYATLAVGAWLPLRWETDLSYGVYIYAWPVGQILVIAGVHQAGLPTLMLATALVTLPLAAASWRFVEEPAQGYARRLAASRMGKPLRPAVTEAVFAPRDGIGSASMDAGVVVGAERFERSTS